VTTSPGDDPSDPEKIVLHLVSHASGEMVEILARNAVAQLANVAVERNLWKMVQSLGQLPEILAQIAQNPGFVVHSIADSDVRGALEQGCRNLGVPYLFALGTLIDALASHFGAEIRYRTGARDLMGEDYFRRIEAMKFTLAHDDGVAADDLKNADVIVVGVSRSTKTPTCMYLASRGIKAANVPLVRGIPLPDALHELKGTLIVGLTAEPARLMRVRKARLVALAEDRSTDYIDPDEVNNEVREARRLFVRSDWPIIDVTHKSIEQVASLIIGMLNERRPTHGADGIR
jgi:regulator of PEP synthase PpsR (kinase-PPPase family)